MPMWNDKLSLGTRICCTGMKINVQYKVICKLILNYSRKDMLSEVFSIVVAVSSRDVHGLVPVCWQDIM